MVVADNNLKIESTCVVVADNNQKIESTCVVVAYNNQKIESAGVVVADNNQKITVQSQITLQTWWLRLRVHSPDVTMYHGTMTPQ